MKRLRVLFIIDKGFAFKIIAEQVAYYLNDKYRFTIIADRNPADHLLRRQYDVIHFLAWDRWQRALSRIVEIKKYTSAPIIVGIHSFRSWDRNWQSEVKEADALAVTCQELQDTFMYSGKPTYLLPNGVDIDLFCPAKQFPKQFTVGFVGAKDPIKGYHEYIEPLAKELDLRLITNEKRLIYGKKLATLYKRMSCYLCASESEGFGMPLLEAAATGIPVISTRVGIAESFVEHGVTGFLVDRDYHQMKEAILHLIANPGLCQTMGQKARQRSAHYRWSQIVQCYDVLYQKIVGGLDNGS